MKYKVVLADPPWKYKGGGPSVFAPENTYPTMRIDELKNLRIGDLCDDNAALFMWCVEWIHPEEWLSVARAWGFEYKTRAWVWIKSNPSGFGFWQGMGGYTKSNPEDCNLFVRGKMPVAHRDVISLIYSNVMEHSRKPDEQYAKIERLYPDGPYLELFARRPRPGWHAWGNEVVSDIQIAHTPAPAGESEGEK